MVDATSTMAWANMAARPATDLVFSQHRSKARMEAGAGRPVSGQTSGEFVVEFALYRSDDSVHLLLHHRRRAPAVIQMQFGPWAPLGWVESSDLSEPLRDQVLQDLAANFFAVVPADEAEDVAHLAWQRADRRPS